MASSLQLHSQARRTAMFRQCLSFQFSSLDQLLVVYRLLSQKLPWALSATPLNHPHTGEDFEASFLEKVLEKSQSGKRSQPRVPCTMFACEQFACEHKLA